MAEIYRIDFQWTPWDEIPIIEVDTTENRPMYQTITQSDFINTFQNIRPESFSLAGLETLYDFIEELERDTGEQSEFDPIALCCDWAEYDLFEAAREYSHIEGMAECADLYDVADLLNEHTLVLFTGNDTLLVLAF